MKIKNNREFSVEYNYEKIAQKYSELKDIEKVAKIFNCCTRTVKRACEKQGVKILSKTSKPIVCYKKNQKIYEFDNSSQAAKKILELGLSVSKQESIRDNITRAARGKRKTAYGFI